MMKFVKILCSLMVVLIVCSAFSFGGNKKVYIMGVSASFTDSLVYFTAVQPLDSVKLVNKMLPERAQYSYQLKNYLEQDKGMSDRTCFIYFSTSKSKLEKTVNKIKTKYRKGKTLVLNDIDAASFRFTKPEVAE